MIEVTGEWIIYGLVLVGVLLVGWAAYQITRPFKYPGEDEDEGCG